MHHLGADDRSSQRIRIVDATLASLASQGMAKTTLDDIASVPIPLMHGVHPQVSRPPLGLCGARLWPIATCTARVHW